MTCPLPLNLTSSEMEMLSIAGSELEMLVRTDGYKKTLFDIYSVEERVRNSSSVILEATKECRSPVTMTRALD